MPLNVQNLIDELDQAERRKVDELTEQLRAEYARRHDHRRVPSGAPDSGSSPSPAANPTRCR